MIFKWTVACMEYNERINRGPGETPGLSKTVLPPITGQESSYRHRYQGTSNPSYLHNEDLPQPPIQTTPMRRELPKTPDLSSGDGRHRSRLEVPQSYRRERRSHSAHVVRRQLPDPGMHDTWRPSNDLESLPDVAFVNMPRYRGSTSPVYSVEYGSRSPKLDSRSSGSRSTEPDAPLIKESRRKSRHEKEAERRVRYKPPPTHNPSSVNNRNPEIVSSSDVQVERFSGNDDVFYSQSVSPRIQSQDKNFKAPTERKPVKEDAVPRKPFNLLPQRKSDLHVVFDIFTHNPLDIPLPPCEAGTQPQMIHPYWSLVRSHQQNKDFQEGMLLRSVTQEAYFPYIHYIIFRNGGNTNRYRRAPSPPTPPEREDNNYMSAVNSSDCSISSGENLDMIGIINSQGGYREMHSFLDREKSVLPKRPQNDSTAYLITAFKTLENQNTTYLDEAWSTWSGADYIVEHMPSVLQLVRVTFHKVKYNNGNDTFHYILMCELANAVPKMSRALCFIESLKLRQCGYSNLYLVDHHF